ncbi:hypothetical protein ACFUAG_07960 [Streptomyces sp. NPDC057193]|uniref:hypothetical protein n=1 Tax=Streptomyces sp. NPDC057193 TaxID=3346043 RepID=UPI00363567F1
MYPRLVELYPAGSVAAGRRRTPEVLGRRRRPSLPHPDGADDVSVEAGDVLPDDLVFVGYTPGVVAVPLGDDTWLTRDEETARRWTTARPASAPRVRGRGTCAQGASAVTVGMRIRRRRSRVMRLLSVLRHATPG